MALMRVWWSCVRLIQHLATACRGGGHTHTPPKVALLALAMDEMGGRSPVPLSF